MSEICECGNRAEIQGYCPSCLADYEVFLSDEVKTEQFEIYANTPRTIEELELEEALTQSLKEPVNDQLTKHTNNKGGHMSTTVAEVKVFPKNDEKRPHKKADVSFTLNGDLVLRGVSLIEGKDGMFLGMPGYYNKAKNTTWDYCFPLTATLRAKMTEEAIRAYEVELQPESQY